MLMDVRIQMIYVVTVTPSPTVVALAAADSVCVNWENVTLSGSPAGGVFSGNGVTDDRFYPTYCWSRFT